jgi:hypothetical protein
MPRAKKPSVVVIGPSLNQKLRLSTRRELAYCLGLEHLTDHCQSAIVEVIDNHKRAYAALKQQPVKTTAGSVSEQLRKLVKVVERGTSEKLGNLDESSGLDDYTFDALKAVWGDRTAIRNVAILRIAELGAMPKVRWNLECLRATCPQVKFFFETFANSGLRSRKTRLRRFALVVLKRAGVPTESFSGKNSNRLDPYLDAPMV